MPEEVSSPAPTGVADGNDKLMAALSYIWIISIIMLLTKKGSDFIQFHARQGFVLFAVSVVVWIISIPLLTVPLVFTLINLVYLVLFVAAVVGFIKAYGGEKYKLPVVGDLADKVKF